MVALLHLTGSADPIGISEPYLQLPASNYTIFSKLESLGKLDTVELIQDADRVLGQGGSWMVGKHIGLTLRWTYLIELERRPSKKH